MPVRPAAPQPPDLRLHYPGLTSEDAEVWTAWLTANKDTVVEVYYDVALGGVIIDDPEIDEKMREGWRYSTAVKIDVVIVTAGENLVTELKPSARLGAIGQALGYATLLDLDPINDLPNTPTIITNDTSQEVRTVAETLGVRLIVLNDQQEPPL